jgi:hydroxymethylpyrimidine/phosphomethylpyrimidine kinase
MLAKGTVFANLFSTTRFLAKIVTEELILASPENSHCSKTPIALTIAGSDSGGGAGIQADLKTFSALGVYGATVITAITAQNTLAVSAVHDLPPDMVKAQIVAVLDDLDVASIKIGMLSSVTIIRVVAQLLADAQIPVVLDPVMVAKSGDILLQANAIESLKTLLLPLATVLTQNLPEAAILLQCATATNEKEMQSQGEALIEMGAKAVLMKGGHAAGDDCIDLLITLDGWCRTFRRVASLPKIPMAPVVPCRQPSPQIWLAVNHY